MKILSILYLFVFFLLSTNLVSASSFYTDNSECKVEALIAPLSFIKNIKISIRDYHSLSNSKDKVFTELTDKDYDEINNNIKSIVTKRLKEIGIAILNKNTNFSIIIEYKFDAKKVVTYDDSTHRPIILTGEITINENSVGVVSKHKRSMDITSETLYYFINEGMRYKYKYLTLVELEKKGLYKELSKAMDKFIYNIQRARGYCKKEL